MEEKWKTIKNFPDYKVSNTGKVFSKKINHILKASDDGNGYLKVMVYDKDGNRKCKKVHRLVAETFVKGKTKKKNTVDHIISGKNGKLDNSVSNLRWVSRAENIKKAYKDGICDERIQRAKKLVCVDDICTGELRCYESVQEAAQHIGKHYTTLSHAFSSDDDYLIAGRYKVWIPEGRERLLYDRETFAIH